MPPSEPLSAEPMEASKQPSLLNGCNGSEKTIRCSVVVPVFRGGARFGDCLNALRSALRPDDELIVVADGESDGSWRIAEGDERIRLVRLSRNRGPAHGRNAGARVATGDLLFFVDADVTVPPDCIHKIVKHFAQEPELAALIGSYDRAPGEKNFLSQYKNLFHHYVHQHGPVEPSTFWGACGAIRHSVFFEIGGFDEKYFTLEDVDLGYRLKEASQRIRMARDLQVTHWKKWDAFTLIRTDLVDRAAQWTELILERLVHGKGAVPRELNLGMLYRLSLATSFLMLVALAIAPWQPRALLLLPCFAGVFLSLHLRLFKFFRVNRGWKFCLQTVFWRFVYDIYSGLGFCYGSARFVLRLGARSLRFSKRATIMSFYRWLVPD